MQLGANVRGDGLRSVDQLHVRHRRMVAVAEAALEDPQVAARAALVARAELDEQLADRFLVAQARERSEEHTSELQSLMRISYAVFCLKKKNDYKNITTTISFIYYDLLYYSISSFTA